MLSPGFSGMSCMECKIVRKNPGGFAAKAEASGKNFAILLSVQRRPGKKSGFCNQCGGVRKKFCDFAFSAEASGKKIGLL
jgi:hypothetical protein